MKTCLVENCERESKVKGFCIKHYQSSWSKNYRLENKEWFKNYNHIYHQKNRESILDRKRNYYGLNKEKENLRARIYREKNLEERRVKDKEYGKNHKWERAVNTAIKKAQNRNLPYDTKESLINFLKSLEQKCIYCDLTHQLSEKFHKKGLSIDRKDNNKGYTIDNIVIACFYCNSVKAHKLSFPQMIQIGNLLQSFWKEKLLEKGEI